MRREQPAQQHEMHTKRKVSNRAFEDMRRGVHGTDSNTVEKTAATQTPRSNRDRLMEEPLTKARLTARARKRSHGKSGISIADE